MNTDPIADMLTRIRNGIACQFKTVKIPASKLKQAIAELLIDHGYLSKSELISSKDKHPYLLLTLRYHDNQSIINGLKRISKPGHRIYLKASNLSKILSSPIEDVIISTSKGLVIGHKGKTASLGGEILFKIW